MSLVAARALVFVVSGAVLVLELLAARLLAPYVGVSVETYTAIIGVVLAGIAAGSWIGGLVADRVDPRRLLGPTVLAGAVLAVASVPIVRSLGEAFSADLRVKAVMLAAAGLFLPALVLSAVNPTVVKLRLRDLSSTGEVVGSFVGVGTFGALFGTFLTGFLLVATVPTRAAIYWLGGLLAVLGATLWARHGRRDGRAVAALVAVAVASASAAALSPDPCDVESAYSCIRVEAVPGADRHVRLWANEGVQGVVDLDDPSRLAVEYMHVFADVIDVAWPKRRPLRALFVGGGAFVMPRYLATTRPGSRSEVLEIDPAVVDVARRRLELRTDEDLRIRTGDARTNAWDVGEDSADLVVGDAFLGLTVPWHLTTREFVGEVDRILDRDGLYLMNVIDAGPIAFARAETATLRERFPHVLVVLRDTTLAAGFAGNIVLAASHRPLDVGAIEERVRGRGYRVLAGPAVEALIDGTRVLTDDFAPVEQLLTRS